MVQVAAGRVVRERVLVVGEILPVHGRVHGAVRHDRPLEVVVVGRTAARRDVQDLLYVLPHRHRGRGRARSVSVSDIRIVALGDRSGPAHQVRRCHAIVAAVVVARHEAGAIDQVVLREVPRLGRQQVGLERSHGGESPAGAEHTLVTDGWELARCAQVQGGRVRALAQHLTDGLREVAQRHLLDDTGELRAPVGRERQRCRRVATGAPVEAVRRLPCGALRELDAWRRCGDSGAGSGTTDRRRQERGSHHKRKERRQASRFVPQAEPRNRLHAFTSEAATAGLFQRITYLKGRPRPPPT